MFKESFKYYKNSFDVPLGIESMLMHNGRGREITINRDIEDIPLSVIELDEWECYEIYNHPGLIFIKNPFTTIGQRYWTCRCLRDYPKSPNVTNLTTKHFNLEQIQDWWGAVMDLNDKKDPLLVKLNKSLRWTTLGYHHDWDTKIYTEDNKTQFPEDLKSLTEFFAKVLGFQNFSAEAAIVNYYRIGQSLAGHTDHSESDLEAPLFSFSFGQTAIFLVAGKTLEDKPSPIVLRSGDVIVMSKESRLCYHAVPRVLKTDKKPWDNWMDEERPKDKELKKAGPPGLKRCKTTLPNDFNMDKELWINCSEYRYWDIFEFYLQYFRININVRQVLKEGQTTL